MFDFIDKSKIGLLCHHYERCAEAFVRLRFIVFYVFPTMIRICGLPPDIDGENMHTYTNSLTTGRLSVLRQSIMDALINHE